MRTKGCLFLVFTAIFASCQNEVKTTQRSKADSLRIITLEKENDSLRALTATDSVPEFLPEEEAIKNQQKPIPSSKRSSDGSGRHPITLQWISWDQPGYANLKPLKDGWYSINGSQRKNEDFLTIEGKIRRISEKELEFEGIIVTRTQSTNAGKPCYKEGKQRFLSTQNRKYYRLQNMLNCEEQNVVDYVDIYYGSSNL